MLPQRKPKPAKRESRWRSPAHTKWVSGFACAMCGSKTNTIAAHVRLGSHTALGRKPDDWRTAPLCDGPYSNSDGLLGCHDRQHLMGEESFWLVYELEHGQTVDQLLAELCRASPKSREIVAVKAERAGELAGG